MAKESFGKTEALDEETCRQAKELRLRIDICHGDPVLDLCFKIIDKTGEE